MSGNHNMYCSGNQPDIVELLRHLPPKGSYMYYSSQLAADEILKLREEIKCLNAVCDRHVVDNDALQKDSDIALSERIACGKEVEKLKADRDIWRKQAIELGLELSQLQKERDQWIVPKRVQE